MKKSVCAIVGVGPGNGAAFARRFSKEGYTLALLARHTELLLVAVQIAISMIQLPFILLMRKS
jgi:short-subunit dehydrogenase